MRRGVLISAIGFVILASGCGSQKSKPPLAATSSLDYTTTDTIKDIMDSILDPNADFLWNAVSVTSNAKGVQYKAPETDDAWQEVRRHTVALIEATNLLLIPNRHVAKPGEKADNPEVEESPESIEAKIDGDRATFESRVSRLRQSALATLTAIDNHDSKAMATATDELSSACQACHLVYFYPRDQDAQRQFAHDEAGRK